MGKISGSITNPQGELQTVDLRLIPIDNRNSLLVQLGKIISVTGSYDFTTNEGYYHFDYRLSGTNNWTSLGIGYISSTETSSVQDLVELNKIQNIPVTLGSLSGVNFSSESENDILRFISGSWTNTQLVTSTVSASYAETAKTLLGSVESASYAITAENLLGSIESASYAFTASFVSGYPTQTYVDNEVSALSSSVALDVSFNKSYIDTVSSSLSTQKADINYVDDFVYWKRGTNMFSLTGTGATNVDATFNENAFTATPSNPGIIIDFQPDSTVNLETGTRFVLFCNNGSSSNPVIIRAQDGVTINATSASGGSVFVDYLYDGDGIFVVKRGANLWLMLKFASKQVISSEITNGTENKIRSFSPADIKSFVQQHGVSTSDTSSMTVLSASYSTTAGLSDFSNLSETASYALTAENLLGSIESASYAHTASYAITAENLLGSIESASYAHTASYAQTANTLLGSVQSASYASTASYVDGYATDTELSNHTTNTNNPHSVTQAQVGLGNVDNTSDLNKPVSIAQQTELDLKLNISETSSMSVLSSSYAETANTLLGSVVSSSYSTTASYVNGYATSTELSNHTTNTNNPHSVTQTQVGLGNVDNTSDLAKPVSTAQQTALNLKLNISDTSSMMVATASHAIYSEAAGDADTLDNQLGSYYLDFNNQTNVPEYVLESETSSMSVESSSYSLSSSYTDTINDRILFVNHGATAGTTRPNAAIVYWVGTVEPTNAIDADLWFSGSYT